MFKDGTLYYVEYGTHKVMTWDGERNAEFWHKEGCGPSAIASVPGGDFLVTCYDAGSIARLSGAGELKVEYTRSTDGEVFQGPNDFVADSRGGIYFTASGPWESDPIVGKIFYMDAKGEIREVANDLHYANGLALSKDGRILYLAESEAGRVIQFTIGENGRLGDRKRFVQVAAVDPDSGTGAYPDGLKTDSQGNLYICQYSKGRIVVVSPDKKLLRTINVPSPAAPNLAFGAGEKELYIMAVDDQNNAPYWGKVYIVPNR